MTITVTQTAPAEEEGDEDVVEKAEIICEVFSVKEGQDSKKPELVNVALYPKSGSKLLSY